MWLGDAIAFLLSVASLIYGSRIFLSKKLALFFKLIVYSIGCHILGFLFDICESMTLGAPSEGFTIGYLGSMGCFGFLLTASIGYMDGILDDGSNCLKKFRYISLLAPLAAALIFIPNIFSIIPLSTKIWYVLLWLPAMFCSYYNLKHAILPDMDFGFVKAIRPFNIAALIFIFLYLIHLTLWNFCGWIPLLISGTLLGASGFAMVFFAERGTKKWII